MIPKIGLKRALSPSWAWGGGCPVSHDDNFTGCSIIALLIQMNKSERDCKANPFLLKVKIVYMFMDMFKSIEVIEVTEVEQVRQDVTVLTFR